MTVTPRRERRERELRRRQREKRGGHAPQGGGGSGRGWLIGLGAVVLVVVAILGLRQAGVLSTAPASPTPAPLPTIGAIASNDPALGVKEADHSNAHVATGTPVQYEGPLPPSSGTHWPPSAQSPVKAGFYDQKVPFEATTHNLEHGGIVIVYNGLSTAEVDQLRQFWNSTTKTSRFAKVLVMPYSDLKDAKVTAVAWDWRLNLQSVDTAALLKFITAHYDSKDAPEAGAAW
jgi:hypothetical protein